MLRPLREASSCVTRHRLTTVGHRVGSYPGSISLVPGRPAPVHTERGYADVALRVRCEYVVIEDQPAPDRFRAAFVSYNYQILDLHDREIIAFHWHPEGVSPVIRPHLHVTSRVRPIEIDDPANPSRQPEPVALAEMHISTGSVPFEDVVRLLIEEFRVVPLRPVWDEILNQG